MKLKSATPKIVCHSQITETLEAGEVDQLTQTPRTCLLHTAQAARVLIKTTRNPISGQLLVAFQIGIESRAEHIWSIAYRSDHGAIHLG